MRIPLPKNATTTEADTRRVQQATSSDYERATRWVFIAIKNHKTATAAP
jgi:hypothetical protein